MSKNVNGQVIIEQEPGGICELCGKLAETRPYGPNGERICYPCGMKDKKQTNLQMYQRLYGMTEQQAKQRMEEESR